MVSRIRIGPEGGPFVTIDEDSGTLKFDAPSGDIDLQANDLLSLGDLDLSGNQLQNAVLLGATLGGALNADGQDIENIATVRSDDIENDQTVTTDSLSSTNINNADTVTTDTLDAVTVDTVNLGISGSLSGGGIQKYKSGSFSPGTNLTFDTGISTDFNGALLTANFKRDASGSLDQYLWFVFGNAGRSPNLIKDSDEGAGVSNVTVDSGGSTYVLVFDASSVLNYVTGVGIGTRL
jgi:hypothetical protein